MVAKSSTSTSAATSFAQLLENAEPVRVHVGEVIEATVITKSKSELWVDIAGLATGYVPAPEVGESGSAIHDINVGDAIYASVLVAENDEGYTIMSIKRAARDRVWVDLAKKLETKEVVHAKVTEANAGGLLLDVDGLKGFLPVSQLAPEHYPRVAGGDRELILDKLTKLIGEELTVQVLDLNQLDNKLILSEKLARSQETEASLSKFEAGTVVDGKITGVVDFGAFVSFQGLEGLIHISEIDWNRVSDPREHLSVGDDVKAQIISIEGNKVSLSLKRLKEDPWVQASKQFSEGDTVKGEVVRVTPFGAFVQLNPDVSGLVHVSELSEEHVENPMEVVKIGDTREFKIISIEPDAHRIALSIKALTSDTPSKPRRAPSKPADLSSLSAATLAKLSEAGYGDMAKLKEASLKDLEAIPGVGGATAQKILNLLK